MLIQAYDYIIIRKDEYFKSTKLDPDSAECIDGTKVSLNNAVGMPYGTMFTIVGDQVEPTFQSRSCPEGNLCADESLSPVAGHFKPLDTKDNRDIVDSTSNQKLDYEDIKSLQAGGTSGEGAAALKTSHAVVDPYLDCINNPRLALGNLTVFNLYIIYIDSPCELATTETKQIAGSEPDPKSHDTDEAAVCARRAVRLARKRVGYEKLMGPNAVPADALIIATRFHPVDLTLLLMQFLPVGKPVVVYAQFLQEILSELIKGNANFEKKTKFSQDKYVSKKRKRHLGLFSIERPCTRILCELYSKIRPEKCFPPRPEINPMAASAYDNQPVEVHEVKKIDSLSYVMDASKSETFVYFLLGHVRFGSSPCENLWFYYPEVDQLRIC
ncbi:hypothetical protein AHF37_08474 [Paragonimus kellicotti]|nr:hypothetical protein AHF37_08474 [Paragonimus kellicotti]